MQFTDDDLKRVKGEIPKGMAEYGFDSMDTFTMEDLQSLVERLEAAEKALEMAICQCPSHGYPEALEAWKKASGKQ